MLATINLATNPLENNRRFFTAVAVLGTAALILTGVLGVRVYREWRASRGVERDIARLSAQVRELEAEQKRLDEFFHRPEVGPVLDRSAYLNSLIARKGVSWTRIFMELERLLPDRVSLVSVTPQMTEDKQLELKLSVAGESSAEIIRFLKTLESSPEFSRIEVEAERHPTGPGVAAVVVELSARFRPPEGE